MIYKIFYEKGDYKNEKGEDINIVSCNQSLSPEGLLNVGWTEAADIDDFLSKQKKDVGIITKKINTPKEESLTI